MIEKISRQLADLKEDLARSESLYTEAKLAADEAEERLREVRVQVALGEAKPSAASDAAEVVAQAREHISGLSASLDAKREAVKIIEARLRQAREQDQERRTARSEKQRSAHVRAAWDAWRAFEEAVLKGIAAEREAEKQGTLPRHMPGGWRSNSVFPVDLFTYNDRTGTVRFRPALANWASRLSQSAFDLRIYPDEEHTI